MGYAQGTIVLIVVLSVVGAVFLAVAFYVTFSMSKKKKKTDKPAKQNAMYSYAYMPTGAMFQYNANYGPQLNRA